jgi:hypothetical protein
MSLAKKDHEHANHNTQQPGTTFVDNIPLLSEPATEREPPLDNGWGLATLDFLDSQYAGKLDKKAYISGHLYTYIQAENCVQFYTLLRNYMKCSLYFYNKLDLAHSTEIDGRSNIGTMLQSNVSPEELDRTVIKAGIGQIHIAMSESLRHRKEKSWYAYDCLLEETDRYIDFSHNRDYFAHAHGAIGKDGFEFTGGIYTTIATKYEKALPEIEIVLAKLKKVLDDESAWEIREGPQEVVAVREPHSEDNGKSNENASEESDDDNNLNIGGVSDNNNPGHLDDDNGLVLGDCQSLRSFQGNEVSQGETEDSNPHEEAAETELPPFEYETGFLATIGGNLLRSRVVRSFVDKLYRYIDRRWTEWEYAQRQIDDQREFEETFEV